jgi:alpha(1,3/1,4) fucosyltransferase
MSERKRELRLWFTGCHTVFPDPADNRIVRLLGKRFDVVIDEKDPELLIASVFGNGWRNYRCKKVYYTGENSFPFRNFFSFSITHRKTDKYNIYWPLFLMYDEYYADYQRMKVAAAREVAPEEYLKRDFCSFVVSNPKGVLRNIFFDRLSEYRKVGSGGRFRNNIGGPVARYGKEEFLSRHRFNLCFENSSSRGYCTEKIVQAFGAKTVPVYWGDPRACEVFNPDAFVNLHDFKTFDAAIERIREIDGSPELWLRCVNASPFRDGAEPPEFSDDWFLDRFEERLGRAAVKGKVRKSNAAFLLYMAIQNFWLRWAMHMTLRTFVSFLANSPGRAGARKRGRAKEVTR